MGNMPAPETAIQDTEASTQGTSPLDQATSNNGTPIRKTDRLYKHFQLVMRKSLKAKANNLKEFVAKSYIGKTKAHVTEIDTDVGRGSCLAGTAKQWDTIIKEAKAANNVPDELKIAHYYKLGATSYDPDAVQPSDAWVFKSTQEEKELDEQLKSMAVPGQAYASARRAELRCRIRLILETNQSDVTEETHPQSLSDTFRPIAPETLKGASTTDFGGLRGRIQDTNDDSHTLTFATTPIRQYGGLDLTYMTRAAEENKNDYEYVKGIGKVTINQQKAEPVEHIEDKPFTLSPRAFAAKDNQFELQQVLSTDLNISISRTVPSTLSINPENSKTLLLMWQGEKEHKIRIFYGNEIACIAFSDIIIIKYNIEIKKIFLEVSATSSSGLLGYLLDLSPTSEMDFMTLKAFCYSLTEGRAPKYRCDKEEFEFFSEKTKAFVNHQKKPLPIPLLVDRNQLLKQKPKHNKAIVEARLDQMPRDDTSLKLPKAMTQRTPDQLSVYLTPSELPHSAIKNGPDESAQDYTPSKPPKAVIRSSAAQVTTLSRLPMSLIQTSLLQDTIASNTLKPATPVHLPRNDADTTALEPAQKLPQNRLSLLSETIIPSELLKVIPDTLLGSTGNTLTNLANPSGPTNKHRLTPSPPLLSPVRRKAFLIDHVNPMVAPELVGLYYNMALKTEAKDLMPVGLNDLVVRLRSEEQKVKGGKSDRFDIFDGPWRIVNFEKPKKEHAVDNQPQGEDTYDKTPGKQLNKDEILQMGKTKIRLKFPKGSVAKDWVELSCLLPVLEASNAYQGALFASNSTVASLQSFKILQKSMQGRKDLSGDLDARTNDLEPETTGAVPNDSDEDSPSVNVVELKKGVFVAVVDVDPQAIQESDLYEVEKLRGKRLRLHKRRSSVVKQTDEDDPWIKRLMKERPDLVDGRIVVAEYKVHWAGWPDEDDSWTLGTGNIDKSFIDEYHLGTDPLRDTPLDQPSSNPESMVFPGDLPKRKTKIAKIASSSGSARSSSRIRGKIVGIGPHRHFLRNANKGKAAVENIYDTEMADTADSSNLMQAMNASLEDSEAKKQTEKQFKAFQKQIGVSATADTAVSKGKVDDGFVAPDEDWTDDAEMADGPGDIEEDEA